MTSREAIHSARRRSIARRVVLRRVIGVPDYDIYLTHLRAHHPGAEPMTREEVHAPAPHRQVQSTGVALLLTGGSFRASEG
jgi:uncharacterized short protein YbdD (DUF466 family)